MAATRWMKIHSPSLSLCVSHTRGKICTRVCVCLCEWGPRLNESGAEKNERKNIIIIKVSPTVLGPMAETSSCFNFRSYRSIGVFWPSCNELATSLPYSQFRLIYEQLQYNEKRPRLLTFPSLRGRRSNSASTLSVSIATSCYRNL
jgi:hypothetical protein